MSIQYKIYLIKQNLVTLALYETIIFVTKYLTWLHCHGIMYVVSDTKQKFHICDWLQKTYATVWFKKNVFIFFFSMKEVVD